eukprot:TRINITY_DN8481_c0_g1_i2.p1 TRINITY_DN8481_c0_g1~~TRINITY_DN8481_c0_g1_i2.p1  ORF type:complete len:409 (+),score=132.68 TRINITY_DN8481_c0_g1_i2:67-1293(+)
MQQALRALDQIVAHVPSQDRNIVYKDVQLAIQSVNGSLVPKWESELVLKGTVPTMHMGQQYHTPVQFTLTGYPRHAPIVAVKPTEFMRPYTKARGYQMQPDGHVRTDYLVNWISGSNLSGLIADLRRRFDQEPPLYATAQPTRRRPPVQVDPQTQRKFTTYLENDILSKSHSSYPRTAIQRIIEDVSEAIQMYPTLIPKEHWVGSTCLVKLMGTVPTRYESAVYNIPVVIYVPQKYPSPQGGLPEVVVNPTADMSIKQNHRNVDSRGLVYCQYLSTWDESKYMKELVAKVVEIFEGEPPVYAVSRRQQPQPQYQYQPQQQMQRPPAQAKPTPPKLEEKLRGNVKVSKADDDAKACIVCYENLKDCVLMPCKHMCVCAACLKDLVSMDDKRACPMCREPIEDVILNIYS